MSQDGSLSLNHRLPACLPSTSSCGPPPSAARNCRFQLPSSSTETARLLLFLLHLSFEAPLHLRFANTDRNQERERERGEKGPFELAVPAICHMPTFAASPFSSSKRSPRQRQPNPPRNSDAISMNGDVQALIRYGGYSKARRILSYEAMNFTVILGL